MARRGLLDPVAQRGPVTFQSSDSSLLEHIWLASVSMTPTLPLLTFTQPWMVPALSGMGAGATNDGPSARAATRAISDLADQRNDRHESAANG